MFRPGNLIREPTVIRNPKDFQTRTPPLILMMMLYYKGGVRVWKSFGFLMTVWFPEGRGSGLEILRISDDRTVP
jgi:hypothetical protein